jgi:hypothetical protein
VTGGTACVVDFGDSGRLSIVGASMPAIIESQPRVQSRFDGNPPGAHRQRLVARHAQEHVMRTQSFLKAVLMVLIIGICGAAAVALGTHVLSKGHMRQLVAKIVQGAPQM